MRASLAQPPLPVFACFTERLCQSFSVTLSGAHNYRQGVLVNTGGLYLTERITALSLRGETCTGFSRCFLCDRHVLLLWLGQVMGE